MATNIRQTAIAGALAFVVVYGGAKVGGWLLDANHQRGHQLGWAIGDAWEGFRSRVDAWTKREAARRQAERRHHRRKGREPQAITPDPLCFTLGPKRVYDPPRDAAEARRDKAQALADYKAYGYGVSPSDGKDTQVFFIASFEATDPRGVRGVMGKLVLRDAAGQALWVTRWHFPSMGNPTTLAPGYPRHELIAEASSGRPDAQFRSLLAAPAGAVRLEWTPHFVAYADGTVVGELGAPIDGEGLPVMVVGNGLAFLQRLRDEAAGGRK